MAEEKNLNQEAEEPEKEMTEEELQYIEEDTEDLEKEDGITDSEETLEGTVEDPEENSEEEKKDEKDEKIQAVTDQYKRLMAEFDNYRKRTEKEKAAQYDMGVMKAVEKLLPVLDNFERGLAAIAEEDRGPVYEGMDKIYKGMVKTFTDMGVEAIEAVGKPFDPNLHNAVLQVENEELESNTVAQELQKGYTYKGNVIRYAMVSVVQ